MKLWKPSALTLAIVMSLVIGCGNHTPPPIVIDDPVATQPVPIDPPFQPSEPSQPPLTPVSENIGDITPEQRLSAEDTAIITGILNGSKQLDGRRHRVLLAGCNYPGLNAELNYCVFDTATRDALGWVKKFKVDPADVRIVRDTEYTKANMIKHIDWVFDDVRPGDVRVICLSSHGSQDTLSDGSVCGIVVLYDMISTGSWNDSTEIKIDYWIAKCKSVPNGSNVVIIGDLCYAGGDIRAVLSGNPHQKKVRAIDGPPEVQARVAAAPKRALMRDANQYSIQWIPCCLDSELSSEGPRTGGSGHWAIWSSIDKNGINAAATLIVRDGNALLRSNQDTQHLSVIGRNNKQPLTKAAP